MLDKKILSNVNCMSEREVLARAYVFEIIHNHLNSNIGGDDPDSRKREVLRSKLALSKIKLYYKEYIDGHQS